MIPPECPNLMELIQIAELNPNPRARETAEMARWELQLLRRIIQRSDIPDASSLQLVRPDHVQKDRAPHEAPTSERR